MKKPILLKTEKEDFKFLLKFSTLLKIRDNCDIDLLNGTDKLAQDLFNLSKVYRYGVQDAEKREFTNEEWIEAFDNIISEHDVMELLDFIIESMALKTPAIVEETPEEGK